MSEETFDNTNRICPYCGCKYQVDEPGGEDLREEECSECGKRYHAYDTYTVTHYAVPDCELNGEQHEFPPLSKHQFCGKCGKWRSATNATTK